MARDTTYDDETLRNAGLRLSYETRFGSIPGLKNGILLEVGFDQTAPNRAFTIDSWVVQFADSKKLQFANNSRWVNSTRRLRICFGRMRMR